VHLTGANRPPPVEMQGKTRWRTRPDLFAEEPVGQFAFCHGNVFWDSNPEHLESVFRGTLGMRARGWTSDENRGKVEGNVPGTPAAVSGVSPTEETLANQELYDSLLAGRVTSMVSSNTVGQAGRRPSAIRWQRPVTSSYPDASRQRSTWAASRSVGRSLPSVPWRVRVEDRPGRPQHVLSMDRGRRIGIRIITPCLAAIRLDSCVAPGRWGHVP
jgi:hypothetical protein